MLPHLLHLWRSWRDFWPLSLFNPQSPKIFCPLLKTRRPRITFPLFRIQTHWLSPISNDFLKKFSNFVAEQVNGLETRRTLFYRPLRISYFRDPTASLSCQRPANAKSETASGVCPPTIVRPHDHGRLHQIISRCVGWNNAKWIHAIYVGKVWRTRR